MPGHERSVRPHARRLGVVARGRFERWRLAAVSQRIGGAGRIRLRAASLLALLPLEPGPLPQRSRTQWFEGFFFRLTDHAAHTSLAVVFGSLRKPTASVAAAGPGFDEHLLVVAFDANGRTGSSSHLLDGSRVTLRGGGGNGSPRATWWSDQLGGMMIDGDDASLDLRLPSLRLNATVTGPRVAWRADAPDTAGPEGWLARTGLLPCHYFVHSFGSRAHYSLRQRGRIGGERHGERTLAKGSALAHIERNWGDTFPVGWVWAQAAARDGAAFLVLTGGRFIIGPLTTDSYVIGLRAPAQGLFWDFRSTDLDRVVDVRRPCEGTLFLNATSRGGRRRIELLLAAPPGSFGEPIAVPTPQGFSAAPGCVEAYGAVAHLAAWEHEALRLRVDIPLAVLEFGGSYQC